MTIVCGPPDISLGVAYRLSEYLDCQARALGENGFQALAGGAMGTAVLSALVTIFIALIGYRLLLGHVPDARDGIGWAVRLGIVLALVTSWPAFQALVYRVAVDAPPQVAAILLPAAGLAGESLAERVQQSYDTIRIGIGTVAPQAEAAVVQKAPPRVPPLLKPLEKTASLLVISTMGLVGALRIAIGFLLAVAPLAIMSLLFRGTNGLFVGWVRGLAGAALALVGATVVTAIHLVAVESELAHLAGGGGGGGEASATVDPQALTTVVIFFALVAVVTTLAALRMGSALKLPPAYVAVAQSPALALQTGSQPLMQATPTAEHVERGAAGPAANARAAAVAEVLTSAVHREQRPVTSEGRSSGSPPGRASPVQAAAQRGEYRMVEPIGIAGRRSNGRRSASARRRDQVA